MIGLKYSKTGVLNQVRLLLVDFDVFVLFSFVSVKQQMNINQATYNIFDSSTLSQLFINTSNRQRVMPSAVQPQQQQQSFSPMSKNSSISNF